MKRFRNAKLFPALLLLVVVCVLMNAWFYSEMNLVGKSSHQTIAEFFGWKPNQLPYPVDIYFLDTSCSPDNNETELQIGLGLACSLEAAFLAVKNCDNCTIELMTTCTGRSFNQMYFMSEELFTWTYNVDEIIQDEPILKPLQRFTGNWNAPSVSALLRFYAMWKFGGIYLDNDVYILRIPEGDFVTTADTGALSGLSSSALGFSNSPVGRRLAEAALKSTVEALVLHRLINLPLDVDRIATDAARYVCESPQGCGGFKVLSPLPRYRPRKKDDAEPEDVNTYWAFQTRRWDPGSKRWKTSWIFEDAENEDVCPTVALSIG